MPEEANALKTYTFKYGKTTVDAPLDEAQVLAELHGHETPPLEDIGATLLEAVEHPIESLPLRAYAKTGDKIALIVSDMTRFWMRQDLVIPYLVRFLEEECGIPDEDLTIVVANGTHAGGDEKTLRTLVTDAVYDRVKVVNHDCQADDLVYLGTTTRGTEVRVNRIAAEADKVICLGACTHHVMAGFGGGRKSILPGISSLETVRHNHSFCLDPLEDRSNPAIGNGVLEGNPLHADMCEAAAMMKSLFMITLVMNAEMKLAHIFAGHWLYSWKKACAAADEIYRIPIREQADVVIASCGGYPKDMSLYQGTKTIDNVESALKPGGTLIIFMEAIDGGGPSEYFDWIHPLVAGTIGKDLRAHFTVPGYIFFLNCEQAKRYHILMLTSVPAETLAPMGIRAFQNMEDLLAAADLQGKSIYIVPNGATVIPYVEK